MVHMQTRLYWTSISRPTRAIEGVVMAAATKKSLVSDIEYYLSQECRTFYQNRGIPYRRGYLFYGPPGTGKTSFAVAMAGYFQFPIYVFSLSDNELNDNQLANLFARIPSRSVLLLEDVDSAGLSRESMADSADDIERSSNKRPAKKGITLSGLLNCLDGPASADGRLLCMTSNSPDSPNPAFVRLGRCDCKILFGYTCAEVSSQLFSNLYTKTPAELYAGEIDHAAVHNLPELAASFASKIPADAKITPAECQAWFLANRVDPLAAVNGAEAWAAEILENKARGANVAKFSNEIQKPAKASPTEASYPAQASPSKAGSLPPSRTVAPPTTAPRAPASPIPPSSDDSCEIDNAALFDPTEDGGSWEDDQSSEYDDVAEKDSFDYDETLDDFLDEYNSWQSTGQLLDLLRRLNY